METEKVDAKNALEEYVYEMRDKLSEQYQQFVTEAVCFFLNLSISRELIFNFI